MFGFTVNNQSATDGRGVRHSKIDDGIDAIYSLAMLLEVRKVPPHNVRAWFIGRSAYLRRATSGSST
jgi:hypothetical protein